MALAVDGDWAALAVAIERHERAQAQLKALDAAQYRAARTQAFQTWAEVTGAAALA